jgi:phosphoribosylformylglycinamidine cyclo-ligase
MQPSRPEGPHTYAASGVDYGLLDPFKRAAQEAAAGTAGNLARFGLREVPGTRGESAYLIEAPDFFLAHVEEGLGTKNRVADVMAGLTGRGFYDAIGQDTVAMIVNDLITVGALPVAVAMHLAVGTSDWFRDARRAEDLVRGFRRACDLAGATWGGGETPTLKGIVAPGEAVLAGSAVGIVRPKERLIRGDLTAGDRIVILAASGIHANGLTLAARVAEGLPAGYGTPIPGGRTYGEALLDPTPIYVPAVEAILAAGIVPHYAANITGHGWRKLMRAPEPFVYRIERIPEVPPVLEFLRTEGRLSDEEAYGNLNMGAGFALFLAAGEAARACELSRRAGIEAFDAGEVEKRGGEKRVIIRPKGIEFGGESLKIR